MSEESTWLTTKEVAAELKISEMTLYRIIRRGAMDAIRVGNSYRIKRTAFNKYINDSRVSMEQQ